LVPDDSNRGALVDNTVVAAGQTRLLFHTFPYRGDPNSGRDCPLNYYVATLRPGLPAPEVERLAGEVCGFTGTGGRLLDNGDLLLVSRNQLQRWRGGEIVKAVDLSSLPALGDRDYDAMRAVHLHAMTPTGDTVLLIPGGGYMPDEFGEATFLLVALDAEGQRRWRLPVLHGEGGGAPEKLWLADDGTVLVHVLSIGQGQDGGAIGSRHLLHLVSREGRTLGSVEIARDVQPSMEDLVAAGEQGMESAMALAGGTVLESVERIAARSAPGGDPARAGADTAHLAPLARAVEERRTGPRDLHVALAALADVALATLLVVGSAARLVDDAARQIADKFKA